MFGRVSIGLVVVAMAMLCLTASGAKVLAFSGTSARYLTCLPPETLDEYIARVEIVVLGKLKKFEYEGGEWKVTLDVTDPIKGIPRGSKDFVFYKKAASAIKVFSREDIPKNATLVGEGDEVFDNGTGADGKPVQEKKHYYIAAYSPVWRDKNRVLFVGETVLKGTDQERVKSLGLPSRELCPGHSFSGVPISSEEMIDYLMFKRLKRYAPVAAGVILLTIGLFLRRRRKARAV